MIKTIKIDFTSEALPAPYAQQCSIAISFVGDELLLKTSLIYIDRESLTQEEIWEEGFSGDDDFHWEGKLTHPWIGYLNAAVSSGDLGLASQPGESIDVFVETENDPLKIKNKKSWIYIMQEILQSTYETSELEAPLQLRYKLINETGSNQEIDLQYSFKDLKVDIKLLEGQGEQKIKGDWILCSNLLREIYIPDYVTEKAEEEDPIAIGTYIDPGDGLWYNSRHAIKNGKKSHSLEKINKLIQEIIQH